MQRRIALANLALLILLPFQNCTTGRPSQPPASTAPHGSTGGMSGGQPYDGKSYVDFASCPDGTMVSNRVVVNGVKRTLYRENCQTVTPRDLSASDVTWVSSAQLQFNGKTLELERPGIPLPGVISWFLQLSGTLQSRQASLYIIDLFGNDAATIAGLKQAGHTVLCTVSSGTVENWNPDAGEFLPAEIGKSVIGGPGERWLDTRSAHVRQIMQSRLNLAKTKGCQGVDFAAADGFVNDTGFPLTRDSQLNYNQWLAFAAHDRGLVMVLDSVPELAPDMASIFDIALAEQCFTYNECAAYSAFTALNKPVLAVEYGPLTAQSCTEAQSSRLSLTFMSQNLDGSRYETCP